MNINGHKPKASVSLDLDDLWTYMKIHGDAGWEKFPSYLDLFIPQVVDVLDKLNLKITFFVVGQDAAFDKNRDLLRMLTKRGHEVANHSFHHEPWLCRYTKAQLRKEISDAGEQIFRVTGQEPVGFRGPGFSWSPSLLEVLAENKYLYDASTFPTYLGPLARQYYFWASNFSDEEKNQRKGLYGGINEGMRSLKPYCWKLASGATLLEIPVTTVPIVKVPFHLSYLLYLSRFSLALSASYLKVAIGMCRITRTEPSFILHPLDLLSGNQFPELAFFPGMDVCAERKAELFEKTLQTLSKHFELVTMSVHAHSIFKQSSPKIREIPQETLVSINPIGGGP